MALEIFKSLNDLNPSFMNILFNKRNNINRRKNDLIFFKKNTITFGSNSLRCLSPHIWNTLPENTKEITSNLLQYIWFSTLALYITLLFVLLPVMTALI